MTKSWLGMMGCCFSLFVIAQTTLAEQTTVLGQRTMTLVNHCPFPVWFGFISGATSRRGGGNGCGTDADCQEGSVCVNRGAGGNQCFWRNPTPRDRVYRLAANGGSNSVSIPIYQGADFAFSGAVAGRTNCTTRCETADCGNGEGGCPPGRGFEQPATQAEFTLTNRNGPDYYDVTLINGVNVPVSMAPTVAQGSKGPYDCGAPGETRPITSVGSCSWQLFPPSNDYKWVKTGGAPCVSDATCPGGTVCGLSDVPGQAQRFKKSCGKLLGHWTANEICARQGNMGTPFNCSMRLPEQPQFNLSNLYGCAPIGSCYQNGASNKCCGCVNWDKIGIPVPKAPYTEQCKNTNPTWNTYVQPTLAWLKRACPTAYTYPYDDMSSTFTCRREENGINNVNYTITFCPGGLTGGVS